MEDFVPFDLAKKLKEKGFDCKTRYGYLPPMSFLLEAFCDTNWSAKNGYSAPTISQVLKWLREEKKIHVEIDIMKAYPEAKLTYWGYNIVLIDKYEVYHFEWNSNSFEQAALAGIEYVIDNLI